METGVMDEMYKGKFFIKNLSRLYDFLEEDDLDEEKVLIFLGKCIDEFMHLLLSGRYRGSSTSSSHNHCYVLTLEVTKDILDFYSF